MGWLRHFFGDRLPEGFPGTLDRGEDVLGVATVSGGGHLIVTQLGLWIPSPDDTRRVGWHLIAKAAWADGVFTLTEAEETREAGKAVLLADLPPVRFTLDEPARVPHLVRQRVDGSIRSRYRKELTPGGAWFVWRKVPGTDTAVLQVRPDPGTDLDVVAAIAAEASTKMANPEL